MREEGTYTTGSARRGRGRDGDFQGTRGGREDGGRRRNRSGHRNGSRARRRRVGDNGAGDDGRREFGGAGRGHDFRNHLDVLVIFVSALVDDGVLRGPVGALKFAEKGRELGHVWQVELLPYELGFGDRVAFFLVRHAGTVLLVVRVMDHCEEKTAISGRRRRTGEKSRGRRTYIVATTAGSSGGPCAHDTAHREPPSPAPHPPGPRRTKERGGTNQ